MVQTKPSTVRWKILALLMGLSFIGYLERMNISIAAALMMPELELSAQQMGWVFSSFMIAYSLGQIPGGWLGDYFGPRRVLLAAALGWGVTTALTGLLPGLMVPVGAAAFAVLLLVRFALGATQAPTYPVSHLMVTNWFPITGRALPCALIMAGLSVGSACTPLLISWLMATVGWRQAFYVASSFAFAWYVGFRWYATDRAEEHPGVNQAEIDLIVEGPSDAGAPPSLGSWWMLLRNRSLLLLALAWFFQCYVFYMIFFWLYVYLIDVRGFSILGGGAVTSLPFVVAAVLAPMGGRLADGLSLRWGRGRARALVGASGMVLSGVTLLMAANSEGVYLAMIGISLCIGFGEFTEGPFWSSAVDIGGRYAGSSSGIMNAVGNSAGIIAGPLVPVLVESFGWNVTFALTAAMSLIGSFCWLGIRQDRPVSEPALEERTESPPSA